MNIVRILHLEWGLPNPLANNYQLSCVLRGIRRHIGDRPHRKTPLTPQLLLQFISCLYLSGLADCALWAAMLLAFYRLLRIGSMLCGSLQCDHSRHVTLADVQLHCEGIAITVRVTKQYNLQSARLSSPYRVSQVMSCVPPKPWLSICNGQPCHAPWENPLCSSSWRHPLGNPWLSRPSPAACGTWPTLPATRTQRSEDTLSGGVAPA